MSFSPNFFLTIFLVKSKLSTAKKSKTTTFSRVFHPKKIDNFLGKSKLNFWTKNEDFEQCEKEKKKLTYDNSFKHRSRTSITSTNSILRSLKNPDISLRRRLKCKCWKSSALFKVNFLTSPPLSSFKAGGTCCAEVLKAMIPFFAYPKISFKVN